MDQTFLGKPYKVILLNDDQHNIDDVSYQIMKALRCPIKTALSFIKEIQTKGEAIIFIGNREHCELIEEILLQINLNTKVLPIQRSTN